MVKIYDGLTFRRVFTLSEFSAANGYSMRARLVNATEQIEIETERFSGSGTEWTLTIPATETGNYTAGTYTLQIIAVKDGEEILAHSESAEVIAAGAADLRSYNRRMLDNLNEVIAAKSTQDYSDLTINGRSIKRMKWDEIIAARNYFARLVQAEERKAAGQGGIRTIQVRFTG